MWEMEISNSDEIKTEADFLVCKDYILNLMNEGKIKKYKCVADLTWENYKIIQEYD